MPQAQALFYAAAAHFTAEYAEVAEKSEIHVDVSHSQGKPSRRGLIQYFSAFSAISAVNAFELSVVEFVLAAISHTDSF